MLPDALREPRPTPQAPAALTTSIFTLLQDTFSEIANLAWGVQYAAGTTTTMTAPPLPLTTADPPAVLTLNSLAFRCLPSA